MRISNPLTPKPSLMRWSASLNKRLLSLSLLLVLSAALGATGASRASNSLGQDLGPYTDGSWRLEVAADVRTLYQDSVLVWQEYTRGDWSVRTVERIASDGSRTVATYRSGILESWHTLDDQSTYTTDTFGRLIERVRQQETESEQITYTYDSLNSRLLNATEADGTLRFTASYAPESSAEENSEYNTEVTGSLPLRRILDEKEWEVLDGIVVKEVIYHSDGSRVETYSVDDRAYATVHYGPYSERVVAIDYL
ncbi:MAG TPA: hypothetical protein VFC80_07310 [Sphaerochaeta sp.]|nr:hypothetical protein [Sphaerochaeta sp.]